MAIEHRPDEEPGSIEFENLSAGGQEDPILVEKAKAIPPAEPKLELHRGRFLEEDERISSEDIETLMRHEDEERKSRKAAG